MTNSSRPLSAAGVHATEKDRLSSVPGMVMSKYWPGKYATFYGSTSWSTRCRMSWVTGSLDATCATARWPSAR